MIAAPTSAFAQDSAEVLGGRLRLVAASGGHDGPLAPILDGTVGPDGLAVSIRFATDDFPVLFAELEKIGVEVHRDEHDEPVCIGRICGAYAPFDSLEELAETQGIVRVEAGWVALSRRPLYGTVGQIGGLLAHARDGGSELTGEGVVIGDVDEAFDIFHPAFLRADGGYFSWIDVDGDGVFTDEDAIDFDENGVAAAGETVTVLDGSRFWYDAQEVYEENRDGRFQTDQDWVYFDENGNGHRDYGTADGFFERDPSYGERLFIVDDVDQDGIVDPNEKFIALDSSKLSALVWGDQRFLRGNDLIYADTRAELQDVTGPLSTGHGTGVGGILAAGTAGLSRFVGVAPDAEIVSLVQRDDVAGDPLITVMNAADSLGVDVLLFEFSSWNFTPLDGSTNAEVAMSTLRGQGMAQINPAGNLAAAYKHGLFDIDSSGTEIHIDVPRQVLDEIDVNAILISMHWDAAAAGEDPILELVAPNGESFTLDGSAVEGARWLENHIVFDTPDVTPNGFATRFVFLGTEDTQRAMRSGEYRLQAFAEGAPFQMHVFVDDYYSGWGEGVGLIDADPATTMCWPSTSDAAFAVGAYAGSQAQPWDGATGSELGELRNFSSRGPRMDGAFGIDIVAPDDPLSPVPAGEIIAGSYAWYGRFGGTSGAGPHVAGAIALLRQVYPSATVAELEQHLIDNTLRDLTDDVPSSDSGWGKLRLYETMSPSLREGNAAPVIDVVPVESNEVALDVRGTSDGDQDEVVYMVDLGYDGEFDFGPAPGPFLQIEAPEGDYIAVVYAYDGRGGRDAQIVSGTVTEVPAILDAGPSPEPDPEDVGDVDVDVDVPYDVSPGSTTSESGCGCATTTPSSWPFIAGFVALLALRRRR
jgi:MYXO-CTERM domain-containing protein